MKPDNLPRVKLITHPRPDLDEVAGLSFFILQAVGSKLFPFLTDRSQIEFAAYQPDIHPACAASALYATDGDSYYVYFGTQRGVFDEHAKDGAAEAASSCAQLVANLLGTPQNFDKLLAYVNGRDSGELEGTGTPADIELLIKAAWLANPEPADQASSIETFVGIFLNLASKNEAYRASAKPKVLEPVVVVGGKGVAMTSLSNPMLLEAAFEKANQPAVLVVMPDDWQIYGSWQVYTRKGRIPSQLVAWIAAVLRINEMLWDGVPVETVNAVPKETALADGVVTFHPAAERWFVYSPTGMIANGGPKNPYVTPSKMPPQTIFKLVCETVERYYA